MIIYNITDYHLIVELIKIISKFMIKKIFNKIKFLSMFATCKFKLIRKVKELHDAIKMKILNKFHLK
jgi:hypothetical protein